MMCVSWTSSFKNNLWHKIKKNQAYCFMSYDENESCRN
jgi:hypothetical protein